MNSIYQKSVWISYVEDVDKERRVSPAITFNLPDLNFERFWFFQFQFDICISFLEYNLSFFLEYMGRDTGVNKYVTHRQML